MLTEVVQQLLLQVEGVCVLESSLLLRSSDIGGLQAVGQRPSGVSLHACSVLVTQSPDSTHTACTLCC